MYKCFNLKSITIPNTITKITSYKNNYPFVGSFVNKIVFEEGTKNIIGWFLYNVTQIKEIVIPSSLINIGEYAFEYCTSLTQIVIPDSITNIGQYAFASTSLTSIILPNKIKIISNN